MICDLKMPHLDGRAFYKALTDAGNPLQRRLIFVTGDTMSPHTLDFLESSGVPYLAKPFLVDELKQIVHQASGRYKRTGARGRFRRNPPPGRHRGNDEYRRAKCVLDLRDPEHHPGVHSRNCLHRRPVPVAGGGITGNRARDFSHPLAHGDFSARLPVRRPADENLASAVALLTEWAPVVVAAAPEKQTQLAFLIASARWGFRLAHRSVRAYRRGIARAARAPRRAR